MIIDVPMAKLAIRGGSAVVPGGLRTKWPIHDDTDKFAVLEALTSGRWCATSHGPDTKNGQFEAAFAQYLGTKHGLLVDNGTNAIALALKAGGVEAGDEVIVPSVTFIATATSVIQVDGIPIFVDIDPETYQMDASLIKKSITDKTKAVIPVHYGGYPANMDAIMEIAEERDLLVVEDCAEAHGSEWRGKKVGSMGHLGAFSFQQGKPLTCGEGGFVSTNDDELAAKCISYANFGRMPGRPVYEHHVAGYNMRMTEIQAALLLSQLRRLTHQTETRYINGEYFASELSKIGGISALKRDPRVTKRGYYFYVMRYDSSKFKGVPRDRFIQALHAEGIHAGTAHNQPLYQNPVFAEMYFGRTGHPIRCPLYGKSIDYTKVRCPVAENAYKNEIVALGKDFLMERESVDLVLAAIRKIKDNVDELIDT
jgi:dTDP-4-amino-4,6-dideoxygalactose transaminase